METAFGNTWWGYAWLKSLNHIDYENRIQRGAAYARKGVVREVIVARNTIRVKFTGIRSHPYRVTIVLPSFFDGEKECLIDEQMRCPAIISRLPNRETAP